MYAKKDRSAICALEAVKSPACSQREEEEEGGGGMNWPCSLLHMMKLWRFHLVSSAFETNIPNTRM